MRLKDQRVLVVGASSGLGRVVGISLAGEGAHVALAGRRGELVKAAAEEAGDRAFWLTCDVRDATSCQAAVDDAVAHMGGLDVLVYTVAVDILVHLKDVDSAAWADAFATNVTGANLMTQAALPHLRTSHGKAVYFSSQAGPYSKPWPALGVYGVTKAALERLVDSWRVENPDIAFTRLVVGPTLGDSVVPSQFGSKWDPELAAEMMSIWTEWSLNDGLISAEDLVATVTHILTLNALVPVVTLLPRAPQ
ncbi:SDR family oxidoreductase [Frankia gtarii]|uniref:SDR family oxidoreductase n=1 Tax=Frankia gtarii TaxID=2950102 RepID=UPI0021C064EA|nr:SDR family oxidoreductase [Frankia gtarii]